MSVLKKSQGNAKSILSERRASDKILAMRTKIGDSSYMSNAVQIIALALSRRIVEQPKVY